MKVQGQLIGRDDIEVEFTVTMTVGELRDVVDALHNGVRAYNDASRRLLNRLERVSRLVDRRFEAGAIDEEDIA